MLVKRHETESLTSEAVYSDCEAYRYRLTRKWGSGRMVNFIMLNPSVADERHNDPTVERCERRARQMGFDGFDVTNIFAWRDTDPFAMRKAKAPEGPLNDGVLTDAARQSDQVIAAWGVHGAHRARGPQVARLMTSAGIALCHLGLTKDGHPRHPLYVPYTRTPELWPDAGG
jgi:hypothetical protein